MTTDASVLSEREQHAIVCLCILAAVADGTQSDLERNEIHRIVANFENEGFDLTSAYQSALSGTLAVSDLVKELESSNAKELAFEMAVCICNVNQPVTGGEKQFLASLRQELGLDSDTTSALQETATTIGSEPLREPPILIPQPNREAELEELIVNRAILAGALEIMPQSLATMAIVPIQIRLVYQIGKSYGYELGLAHAKEFLATIGLGLTSQVVEGYLSRLVRGTTKHLAGRMVAALASQASQSAIAFATTYALGQAAKAYYASGRQLSTDQLREVFAKMLTQGRTLKTQYAGQMAEQAKVVDVAELAPLVQQI